MHIVLMGYLFVIAMLAAASGSWVRGGLILFFLAVLPCWYLLWRLLRNQRRRQK